PLRGEEPRQVLGRGAGPAAAPDGVRLPGLRADPDSFRRGEHHLSADPTRRAAGGAPAASAGTAVALWDRDKVERAGPGTERRGAAARRRGPRPGRAARSDPRR